MKNNGKIFFYPDLGSLSGFGHLSRCIALAEMVKGKREIVFIVCGLHDAAGKMISDSGSILELFSSEKESKRSFLDRLGRNDIVVLDGYSFHSSFQKSIKAKIKLLVSVDDLHQGHFFSDVVINHSGHITRSAYDTEPGTDLYLGPKYAMLRKPFLSAVRKKRTANEPGHVLISMGGSDPTGITAKVLKACLQIPAFHSLSILLTSAYRSKDPLLKQISRIREKKVNAIIDLDARAVIRSIADSDLVISPASTFSLEVCAVGCLLMTGITASNQEGTQRTLLSRHASFDLGRLSELTSDQLAGRISGHLSKRNEIRRMIPNQRKMIDGKSGERIKKIFHKL